MSTESSTECSQHSNTALPSGCPTDSLCLDVRQHVIGYLGLDLHMYLYTKELKTPDILTRGPKESRVKRMPSKSGKGKKAFAEPKQLQFPWLGSREIHERPDMADLTTVQLISSVWYHAFHSTSLEADHIVIYRQLLMRRRIKAFNVLSFDYWHHVWLYKQHQSHLVLDGVRHVQVEKLSPAIKNDKKGSAAGGSKKAVTGTPGLVPPSLPQLPVQLSRASLDDLLDHAPTASQDIAVVVNSAKDTAENMNAGEAQALDQVISEFARASFSVLTNSSAGVCQQQLTELGDSVVGVVPQEVLDALKPIASLFLKKGRFFQWSDMQLLLSQPGFLDSVAEAPQRFLSDPLERKRVERVAKDYYPNQEARDRLKIICPVASALQSWYVWLVDTNRLLIKMTERQCWLSAGKSSRNKPGYWKTPTPGDDQDSEDPFFDEVANINPEKLREEQASAEFKATTVYHNELERLWKWDFGHPIFGLELGSNCEEAERNGIDTEEWDAFHMMQLQQAEELIELKKDLRRKNVAAAAAKKKATPSPPPESMSIGVFSKRMSTQRTLVAGTS